MLGATVEYTCFCIFPYFWPKTGFFSQKADPWGEKDAYFQESANGPIMGRFGNFARSHPVFALSADR
jgi:hypothetical protein